MDFLGLRARKRQRALLTALRSPSPKSLNTVGPPQPHDPDHPGSDNYPFASFITGTLRLWHFKASGPYPTTVTYLVPEGPIPHQRFPVIAVSPGPFLDRLDYYALVLRHFALKGYVVLFVDSFTGPADCRHGRMAREFLEAVWQTIARRVKNLAASPIQIAWWGHSAGAKVQALAAGQPASPCYLRPRVIIANHFSNATGPGCQDDAFEAISAIPADVWYTVIKGDQDTLAKDDPRRLYESLNHLEHRQLITALSYPEDHLVADHEAPLAAPAPLLDPKASVDGLDWWLYWKIAVGAFDYHFKGGPAKWAYGSERENGGTDAAGRTLKHLAEP